MNVHPIHPACEQYDAELAELALGTLSGRERAATLEHVDSCPRCADVVEDLSHTVDSLLQIAPEAEPPLGFEVRLFERLGLASPPVVRSNSRSSALVRRRLLLAAAAVLVALGAFGGGFLLHGNGPATTGHQVAAGALEADLVDGHGVEMGQVLVSHEQPAWLFMYVLGHGHPQKLWCELRLTNGRTLDLGTFWTGPTFGVWSAPLKVPASEVAGARVVAADGATVASASFAT